MRDYFRSFCSGFGWALAAMVLAMAFLLSGCGGGGGTAPGNPVVPPVQPPPPPPPSSLKFAGIFRASGTPGYAGAKTVTFAKMTPIASIAGLGPESVTMSEKRQYHAAALLQDGRVLITGGSKFIPISNGEQLVSLDSADIYDPAVERFYPVLSKMSSIRSNHQMVTLSDGRVVLIGGTTGGGPNVDAVEIFDPATNQFSIMARFQRLPAVNFVAFDIGNGRILVYGGENTDGPAIIDTKNWTSRVITFDQLHMREQLAGLKLGDGRVLLSGGHPWWGDNYDKAYDDIIEFNPRTDTFQVVGKMSIPRTGHSMLLLPDGKVAIYGGVYFNANQDVWSAKVDVFDPATGTTTAVPDLIRTIYGAYSSLLQNGYTLHIGGWLDGSTISNAEIIYDHATSKSGYTGALTVARSNFTATPLNNGLILVTGGTGNGVDSDQVATVHSSAEIFDPQSAVYLFLPRGAVLVGDSTPMQIEPHASGAVTWSADLGTIDQNGLYTAPVSVGDKVNPIALVTASLTSDPTKNAQAFITLITDAVSIIAPATTVGTGGQLTFSAKVAHYEDQRVSWTATDGAIDANGIFTAPAIPCNVKITATSVANPSQSASVVIMVE